MRWAHPGCVYIFCWMVRHRLNMCRDTWIPPLIQNWIYFSLTNWGSPASQQVLLGCLPEAHQNAVLEAPATIFFTIGWKATTYCNSTKDIHCPFWNFTNEIVQMMKKGYRKKSWMKEDVSRKFNLYDEHEWPLHIRTLLIIRKYLRREFKNALLHSFQFSGWFP